MQTRPGQAHAWGKGLGGVSRKETRSSFTTVDKQLNTDKCFASHPFTLTHTHFTQEHAKRVGGAAVDTIAKPQLATHACGHMHATPAPQQAPQQTISD